MSKKGSQQATSTTTSAPTPEAKALYDKILQQAQGVAATPYTAYGGELVAGLTPQQQMGIASINAQAGSAQPSIQQALQMAQQAAQPLTAEQIQQYVNPYTQNVVNATQAQFANQNAQQRQGVVGNAIAQGALGGNREAIAEAELANQQQLAQAPVIANLMSQGYGQGVSTALAEQQARMAGAQQVGNLGIAGQQAGLAGAGAQLGAGTLGQQTQQAADLAAYQQFQNQQAYPFQTLSWLAGLGTGVGSQLGGTTTGTQTQPQPGWGQQLIGGLTAAGGLFGSIFSDKKVKENIRRIGKTNDGQHIYLYNYKGDPTPRVGLIAQDVEKVHPEAVTEIDGIKAVDYEKALKHAVRRARGGAISRADGGQIWGPAPQSMVAGEPWERAVGIAPKMNITRGRGAPEPMHMHAPAQTGPQDFSKLAKNLGSLASNVYNKIKSNPSSQFADTADASSTGVAPAAGPPMSLAPPPQGVAPVITDRLPPTGQLASLEPDFDSGNAIFYRGGGVPGYADGGAPDLDEGVANHTDFSQPFDVASLDPKEMAALGSEGIASPSIVPKSAPSGEELNYPNVMTDEELASALPKGLAPSEGGGLAYPNIETPSEGEVPSVKRGATRAASLTTPEGEEGTPPIPPAAVGVAPRPSAGIAPNLREAVKRFEGYTPRAGWDYKQYSSGYGTKAAYPGEVIDRKTAEMRLDRELGKAASSVNAFAPDAPEGVQNALTSLTYNSGTKWMNSGLGRAIKAGDYDTAKKLFLQYNRAGDKVNPGLVSRRMAEARWFDNPDAGGSPGVRVASADTGVMSDAEPPEAGPLTRGRPQGVAGPEPGAEPTEGRPGFLSRVDLSPTSKLWPALTAAGFSMMASRAPNIGQAIGEGGLTGMQTYAAEKQTEQEQFLNREKAEREERRLDISEQRALAYQDKIENSGAPKAPSGFRYNEQGVLEFIPGGPQDPAVLKAKADLSAKAAAARGTGKVQIVGWDALKNPIKGVFVNGAWVDPITQKPLDTSKVTTENPQATTAPEPQPTPATPVAPGEKPPSATQGAAPGAPGFVPTTPQQEAQHKEAQQQQGWVKSYGAEGADRLKNVPPDRRGLVTQAINGDIDVNRLSPQLKSTIISEAIAIDPEFSTATAPAVAAAKKSFLAGKDGDTLKSFTTAIEHMDTLKELTTALGNGDWKTYNALKNRFQKEFGYPAPTNFEDASRIVGQETVKAIVAGGGGVGEREEAVIKGDYSPKAIMGALNTRQELMGGQLIGLKQKYTNAKLRHFEELLSPAARRAFEGAEQKAAAREAKLPAGTAGTAPSIPAGDIEKLVKNPSSATYFDKHYGTGAAERILKGTTPTATPAATPKVAPADALKDARAAIAKRPDIREAVTKRLQDQGIDTTGL